MTNLIFIYLTLVLLTVMIVVNTIRLKRNWVIQDKDKKEFEKLLEEKKRILMEGKDENGEKNGKKYLLNNPLNQFTYKKQSKINKTDD